MNLQKLKELAALAGVAQSLQAPDLAQQNQEESTQNHRMAAALQLMGLQQGQASDAATQAYRQRAMEQDQQKFDYTKTHDAEAQAFAQRDLDARNNENARHSLLVGLGLVDDATADPEARKVAAEVLRRQSGFEAFDAVLTGREKEAHRKAVAVAAQQMDALAPDTRATYGADLRGRDPSVFNDAMHIVDPQTGGASGSWGDEPVALPAAPPVVGITPDRVYRPRPVYVAPPPVVPGAIPYPTYHPSTRSSGIPFHQLINQ